MASSPTILGIAARRFRGRRFGEQTSYLKGLLLLARRKRLTAYVFTASDIDWNGRRVHGWTVGRQGWKRERFRFPHAIYDRAWNLGRKGRKPFADAMNRFIEDEGIPLFNPDFGDKLDVYRMLCDSKEVRPHLPETLPLNSQNLRDLGEVHRVLYVKPRRGRQGKGIALCRRQKNGWQVQRRLSSGKVVRRSPALDAEVVAACRGGRPQSGFLVQQGLDLIRVRGGAVDLRVIVQRDGRGEWSVTGMGARVGQSGGFVSNLHAGGRACSLTALAKYCGGHRISPRKVRASAVALALETAHTMTAFHPHLGEIGLDLGLDTDGRLWILEVNRQPGRALFVRAGLRRSWRRSRIRVVEYARYLAKNGSIDPSDRNGSRGRTGSANQETAPIPPPHSES